MAGAGMILAADLISTDQVNWKPAGQVKGLFQTESIVEGGGVGGLFPDSKPTPPLAPIPATQSPTHLQPGQNLVPAVLVDTDNDGDTIHFRCRSCDKPIRAGKKWAGKKFKCPRCGYTDKIRPTPTTGAPSATAGHPQTPAASAGEPDGRWPLPLRLLVWFITFVGAMAAAGFFQVVYGASFGASFSWSMVPFMFFFVMWGKTKVSKT
jgi:phage FluMu protein Com